MRIEGMALPAARPPNNAGDTPASDTVSGEKLGKPARPLLIAAPAPNCTESRLNQPGCLASTEPPLRPSMSMNSAMGDAFLCLFL
jgi:hypothetical protein